MKSYSNLSRRKDLILYTLILCIATAICGIAFSYPQDSSAFPRLLGIILFLVSAISAIGAFRTKPTACSSEEKEDLETSSRFSKLPMQIFVMTGLYILALTKIGFFVSTYFFIFLSMYILKYRNKTVLLVWPIILCGIIWLIFSMFLKVPTPEGILF